MGDKVNFGGKPLRSHCAADSPPYHRSCQDAYSLMCHTLTLLPDRGVAVGFDADACITEYNAPRPHDRHFRSPESVHRQLPGLRAKGWWAGEDVPYISLKHMFAHAAEIQEEIMHVVGAAGFLGWDPLKNDPTLTVNAQWDPQSSWDAIPLFFDGRWIEDNCALFPRTCALMHKESAEFEILFDPKQYSRLVPHQIRERLDYDEVPTLGIKLYRIWPKAGLKAHTGSPARLVNSLALYAPPNSTVTVAGETRAWVTGQMHHFDDSFFHSVDNPSATEARIVLAFVTWHPDLQPLNSTSGMARRSHSIEL